MLISAYWRSFKYLAKTVRHSLGQFPRECLVCGYRGRLLGHGYPYLCDTLCPQCGTLPRHRLLAFANRDYDFFHGRDILHFAPEPAVGQLVQASQPRCYVTADLFTDHVDRREDVEALTLPDESIDVVICLHVLEHVDDRKAAAELFRVLRPGGMLLAMAPIVEGWDETYEDDGRVTPEERLLYFGQKDHARYFGRDLRERLAGPGFIVEEYTAIEPHVSRYGLIRGEKVFICSRPSVRRWAAEEEAAPASMPNARELPAALQALLS